MDDRPYFYRLRGRTLGPIGLQQIRQLAQRAQVGRGTDVSRDGLQWVKASDFTEIFVAGSGSAPPAAVIQQDNSMGGGGGYVTASQPGMPSGPRWYYTLNGNQQGPVDLSTLQQLVASGSISSNEHVIPEGGSQWITVTNVPQLSGHNSVGGMPLVNVNAGTQQSSRHGTSKPEGTNGMAIAGFVLSLLGCGLLGLIFSLVALNSKNRANRGLAIAGAIIGGLLTLLQCAWGALVFFAALSNV